MSTHSKKERKIERIENMKAQLKAAQLKRTEDKFEVSRRLRELRKENDLTQEDVAEIIGKSINTFKKYENGSISITPDVAFDLATIYDTTPDYIRGFSDDRHIINKDNITKEIGLTEQSVNILHKISSPPVPIIDDLAQAESKKTIDFINYALSNCVETTGSLCTMSYIHTIFTLLYDYVSFVDGEGEFRTTCHDGNSPLDEGYILYETSFDNLPIRLQLDDYTKLLLKDKIIETLDDLRKTKNKEYFDLKIKRIKEDIKDSKPFSEPITLDNLDSIGYEIVNHDMEHDGVTIKRKGKQTSK